MTKFDCRILSNIEVEYGFQSNIFNSEKSVSNGAKIVEYSSNMRFSNIRVHHYIKLTPLVTCLGQKFDQKASISDVCVQLLG